LIDNPTISKVRAVLTTPWGNRGYRPIVVRTLNSYYIDTAIDNDADTWTCEIADPHGVYFDVLERDNEIRVQLFGVGRQGNAYILTGFADEAGYDEEGALTLTGRDLSSLAVDSAAPPQQLRKQQSWRVVNKQAKEVGFHRVNLSRGGKMHNVIYTDGSESYWEFWYRLARQDKYWLWCEPDGTLMQHKLNYTGKPAYFLGSPHKGDSAHVAQSYIPVERLEIHKTTQQRVGEVWVFGHRGEIGFREVVKDPAVSHWHKRPRKIMLDTTAHTIKGARNTGREEIFEGKVGSVEYKVTIADPGYQIKQNQIARLNVPQIGLFGEFFVVGTRIQAGSDGFLQEIRLREKQYAVSRRVPEAPKLASTQAPQRESVLTQLASGIAGVAEMPESWGQYLISAANEFHGPWDFNLFLATIIGMMDQESGFRNVREGGSVIWYPSPDQGSAGDAHRHGEQPPRRTLDEWKRLFANSAGTPGNPFSGRSVNAEAGVGPLQLTSTNLKYDADDHFRPNFRDQYNGGRWHPEHNIWSAAKYLRSLLKSIGDTGQDNLMWSAVSAYNVGHVDISPGSAGYRYMLSVKNRVLHSPGYLKSVTAAVQAARQAAKAAQDNETDPNQEFQMPKGLPTKEQCLAFFNSFRPGRSSVAERRAALLYAAMWARWSRPLDYSMTYARGTDFEPPPNVPFVIDCSGFVSWCYKSAGAPDPAGGNYTGWTGPLWDHGTSVSIVQLKPGDLVFYGNPHSTHSHVVIYIGHNHVASHGSAGGPWIVPVNYRSDLTGFRTYRV
jgi:prophage tail gpP-like protein